VANVWQVRAETDVEVVEPCQRPRAIANAVIGGVASEDHRTLTGAAVVVIEARDAQRHLHTLGTTARKKDPVESCRREPGKPRRQLDRRAVGELPKGREVLEAPELSRHRLGDLRARVADVRQG
jgi:hypothetical protein